METLLSALDREQAKLDGEQRQSALRVEYLGLLKANDPAKAGRLIEVATALGQSPATVKNDLALIRAQLNPPAAPPPAVPAAEMAKMNGSQLLALGIAQQHAARPSLAPAATIAPVIPIERMNSHQLLQAGVAERSTLKLPQHA